MADQIKLSREFRSNGIPELSPEDPVLVTVNDHVDLGLRDPIRAQPTCGVTKSIIEGGNLGVPPLVHVEQGGRPVKDQSEGFYHQNRPLTR